jgi:hypothetical protein
MGHILDIVAGNTHAAESSADVVELARIGSDALAVDGLRYLASKWLRDQRLLIHVRMSKRR